MAVINDSLYAVILAGGSGTRFWPLSREYMPKQSLDILGDRSMFALTLDRTLELAPPDRIWVVTTRSQSAEIHRQLHMLGMESIRVLEEPLGRNTAAAIGLAAVHIRQEDPQSVLAVFPADHHIKNGRRFNELLEEGSKVASRGWLVTLGITPTRPETGFGYIQKGSSMGPSEVGDLSVEVFSIKQFTEKPDLDLAKNYLRSGDFFWNSGIFLWRAEQFMDEMGRFLPEHHRGLLEIHNLSDSPGGLERVQEIYASFEAISVDYGILERSDRVALIPADMGWSDVGSWAALREILKKDDQGNVTQGDVLLIDAKNSLVRSEERLVAALGIEGFVVVDTTDALLVCPEDRSQDVRKIATWLRDQGRNEALLHRKVLKPWGAYKVLDLDDGYQVKWLVVDAGKRLSLQSHRYREEHWVVVSGIATVTVDDRVIEVPQGAYIHIPRKSRHRVENRGKHALRLVEVQTGEYLSEDDIIRYEDDYGRLRKV